GRLRPRTRLLGTFSVGRMAHPSSREVPSDRAPPSLGPSRSEDRPAVGNSRGALGGASPLFAKKPGGGNAHRTAEAHGRKWFPVLLAVATRIPGGDAGS